MRSFLTALALLAALAGPAAADQNDPRLEGLFEQLKASDDPTTAKAIEQFIWRAWMTHDDGAVTALMDQGNRAMNEGDAIAAARAYDQIIAIAPDYAEGWNRRATLRYLTGDYEGSLEDIDKVLELEPRHFGALSGRGLVFSAMERWPEALVAFEEALEVYPTMRGPQLNAEAIRQRIGDQKI